MIKKLSHTCIYVLNQNEAKIFYSEKLGFKIKNDVDIAPDFRWVTITAPEDPDHELTLMEIKPGMMWDEQSASQLKALVSSGKISGGILRTDDCEKSYHELKAKGVQFLSKPEKRHYGIEAILKDNSGNWFSLIQQG